jgi:UDP-N-acetylmuramate dehydrogenase
MTIIRGQLDFQVPLARYTSWRIGGPAERLFIPADLADLSQFLQQLPVEENITYLGLGSNTLVRDGGIKGTVIITQGRLNQITQIDAMTIRAEAGVACAQLARFCARLGLGGLEFLAGVPGTVGGALMLNAGAHGCSTWDYVSQVEVISPQGVIQTRMPTEYQVGYRHVELPAVEWFTAGYFRLQPCPKQVSLDKIRDLLAHRAATQPTGDYSCGSVFRNPPGDYAARLIESAGLKGYRLGGACVSTKHANFIINDQQASAADVEALIEAVAENVYQTHAVRLIREVHIIGEG